MLLHREWIVCSTFDCSVICNDHASDPFDNANAGDDAGGWNILAIHLIRGKGREFKKRTPGIDQRGHPIASKQLATFNMLLPGFLGSSLCNLVMQGCVSSHDLAQL